MQRELYFDISSEKSGGSLYRLKDERGNISFLYQHSTYDDDTDDLKVFETNYPSFESFWQYLTRNNEWFYMHPLFVHREQRAFMRQKLEHVDWNIYPNKKWQESHQRQWKKVLESREDYYRSK
jgi:hypothetical protein